MSAAEELHGFPDEETLRATRVEQAMKFLSLVIDETKQKRIADANAWAEMVGDHVTPEGLKVIEGLNYLGSEGVKTSSRPTDPAPEL